MSPEQKRRGALLLSLMVGAAALGFLMFGSLGDNLVYYWSPTELIDAGTKAQGASIRLGGMVVPGSVVWDEGGKSLTFQVTDNENTVTVHNRGVPPEMFREGIGTVVEGTIDRAGVFQATRLLVSHNNEYRAPDQEDGHMDDPFKSVEGL
ncbi:MAG: cytochrome c maturation protein CcmE [Deltaproteobacteria bacterium]|nr:cytochrome c maturation protein CcmE [Deltaproteobacteria bacterium]